MSIYKSTQWERKRQHILRRDKYKCQHLARYGKSVDATVVHHIYPAELYPEYTFCDWNLISLSVVAHNMMHDRDTHELTDVGKELMRRTKIKIRNNQGNIPPSI